MACFSQSCGGLIMKRKSKKKLSSKHKLTADSLIFFNEGLCLSFESGLSILQAMDMIARCCEEPLRTELRYCVDEHRLGMNPLEALVQFSNRVGSYHLQQSVRILLLIIPTGGSCITFLRNFNLQLRSLPLGRPLPKVQYTSLDATELLNL